MRTVNTTARSTQQQQKRERANDNTAHYNPIGPPVTEEMSDKAERRAAAIATDHTDSRARLHSVGISIKTAT